MKTKLRLFKTAKLLALLLPGLLAALMPAARAQTTWVIGADSGTTAFPAGSDVIHNGDTILLYMNPTGGGPGGLNPLINATVQSPISFSVLSGDGNWYAITNPAVASANADPTNAFSLYVGSTLTLGNIIFANNNTKNANGAALIFNSTNADNSGTTTITGTAAFINNHSGNPVTTTNNNSLGAAIHTAYGALMISGSFLFQGNSADRGGAINTAAQPTDTFLLGDLLFQSNTANVGGAINFQQYQSDTVTFDGNIRFIDNYSSNGNGNYTFGGGAIATNVSANTGTSTLTMIFSGTTLFSGNRSASYGGAIKFGGQNLVIGGNTTFENNISGSTGGAIFSVNTNNATGGGNQVIGGVSITLDATDGDILFRGNVENTGADFSQAGDHNAISIYTSGTYNTANTGSTNITLNTGAGGNTIYFYDPISISNTAQLGTKQNKVNVNVTGNGTVLFDASLNPNNSAINGLTNVQSGLFKLANGATYTNVGAAANGAFTLQATATLAAAGAGNLLGAPTITLAANSSLLLDLAGLTPASASPLTFNATTLNANNWTQNLTILNPDALTLASGTTFSLITLTGAGAASSLFNTTNVATLLANTTGLSGDYSLMPSTDGLSLLLLYGTYVPPSNNVLNWTGAASSSWLAANWLAAGSPASYMPGDIVNLADATATGANANTINVDTAGGVTIAAMYVSGTANYTITGSAITASATIGSFTGSDAATGQLYLGAKATDDAGALDTTDAAAYTGTLTLSNTTNNFQGGILINSGALAGNAANLGSGTGGIAIGADGMLIFDQAANATYTATIRSLAPGAGALLKTNTAALTLAADNSAYTGMTTVNAGALLLAANAALGGNIAINTAATFGGSGTAGAVTVNTGATLQVGLGTQDSGLGTPTLTLTSNLNLLDGSLLNYTNINNTLLLGGALAQTGATTLNIATISTGSHSIIDSLGGLAGFQTSLLTLTYKGAPYDPADYRFDTDGNLLWLTILNVQLGANSILTWTGAAADGLWLTSTNWNMFGAAKTFAQGDIVNLAGASPTTITLADSATAAAIYISGNASYTLTGAGNLVADATASELAGDAAATGKLVLGKNAIDQDTIAPAAYTGTLDLTALTGANNFAGGVEIATGALRVSNTAQLGTNLSQLQFTGTNATLIIAPAADNAPMTYDGAATGTNRLVAGTGATLVSATIIAEPGATLAIQNSTGAGGGALYVSASTSLVLTGTAHGAGGAFLFNANTSAGLGGAIYVTDSTSSLAIDNATFTGNKTTAGNNNGGAIAVEGGGTLTVRDSAFSNNTTGAASNSQANGAAISGRFGANLDIANVLFTGNTANGIGGAIFNNTGGAQILVASSTFTGNTAAGGGGGAIGFQMTASNTGALLVRDSLFQNNTASGGGGAIWLAASITGTIANTLIQNNTAANGGALYLSGTDTLTLVDTSLLGNTSGTSGGAIDIAGNNNTLTLNVTSSHTAQIAGNTAAGAPSGIYFASNTTSFTVNTDAGASLDMLDPMSGALTNVIVKTGNGAWNLGGNNILGTPGAANTGDVSIHAGTLHLYRAGETSGARAATTGNLTLNGYSFFAAYDGATLSAGGGNTIQANTIVLDTNITLALDLTGATTADTGYSVLTLNGAITGIPTSGSTTTPNNWTQNLDLLNIEALTPADGDTYNLITVSSTSGALFTSPSTFNLLTTLPDGYTLQLSDDSSILELNYTNALISNTVLTWTGAASNLWNATGNWTTAGTGTNYNAGDIVNLAATPATTAITVNTYYTATIAAMYVSGTENYTITGTAITADATAGKLAGTPAATGKLILGARSSDDATAIDTGATAAYTGTLTLANLADNFLGGIEINTGALAGNDQTLGAGAPGITIAPAATLIFDQATDATYAGLINGAGSLVKTNTAALTLAADNHAYAGATEVATGKLLLAPATPDTGNPDAPAPAPATLGGSIQVDTGASFGGAGTATGPVSILTGGALQVGTGETGGQTLTLAGPLTLADNAIIDYTDITNALYANGSVTPAGATAITIDTFQSGTHNLGNIASLLGNLTVTIATSDGGVQAGIGAMPPDTGARLQAAAVKDPASNNLLLIGIGESRILTWTGANTGTWSTLDANWTEAGVPNPVNRFMGGDRVYFDDTAPATAPHDIYNSGSNIKVSDMFVLGASNWSFTGAGITGDPLSIVDGDILAAGDGAGKLTKAGTGTLALNNDANNFQGGIEIDGGAITFNNASQLGDGGSGAGILFGADSALISTATSAQTLPTAITVATAATGTLAIGTYNLTLDGALAATGAAATLEKTGTAILIYTGTSAGADSDNLTIKIDEGLLRMTGATFTGTVEALADAHFVAQASSALTPDVTVGSAIIDTNALLQLNTGVALHAGSITFAGSSTLTTGNNAGSVSIDGAMTLNGIVNAEIPNGNTLAISSLVDGEGGFLKTGVGELRLNGPDALGNTGVTQIDAGTLRLTDFNGTADSSIDIPAITVPLQYDTAGVRYYIIPSQTYFVSGSSYFVFPDSGTIKPSSATDSLANLAATTYTVPAETYVIPSCTVTIGGTDIVYDSASYSLPAYSVTIPRRTRNIVSGTTVVIGGTMATTSFNMASTVTQNIVLNGGTFAFGTGTISTATAIANDTTANNWIGVRLIQGDNAASSVITGTNDIIHVGPGSQDFSIRDGIYVAIDAGSGAITTFSNSSNNFVGSLIVDSGTLLVTDTSVLGLWGTTNTAKFVLNGGALHISTGADLITTRGMDVRADSIINVDDGLYTQWGPITDTAGATATLYKVGSGTFLSTGAFGANGLVVEEGRYIAQAFNGTPSTFSDNGTVSGTVTVYAGAVFEFNGTNTALSSNTLGLAADQPYILSGNGNNAIQSCSFTGAGTLEITSGKISVTSPNIDIANILISGPNTGVAINGNQTMNFGANSTITVDQGMLVFASPAQNLGDVVLKNGATLAFMMDGVTTSGTFTTAGLGFKKATLKSLNITDGTIGSLWFNTNLALGRGDNLTVSTPISGTYAIGIDNVVLLPAKYTAAIQLINAPSSPDAAFFTPGTIDLGLYNYIVTATTGPTGMGVIITGTGAMSNGASFINQMAAAMPMTFFTELDSVSQRLGELHFEQRAGNAGLSTWLRGYGGRTNYNQKISGYRFDETTYGAEAGADYKFGGSVNNLYVGAFAGYGQGQRSYTTDGSGGIDSAYAGVYQTFSTPSGWYLDGLLKLNNFRNYFTANAPTGEATSADYHNWAAGASLEFGKYIDFSDYGWFFTPSVQVAFTVVTDKTYDTDSGMTVEQRASAITRARAGFQFGRVYETQKHGTVNAYIKFYGGGQWMTDGQLLITTPLGQDGRFAPAIKGYYLEGGLGVSWQLSKVTQFYFDYDTTDAEYYIKPWSLNGGLRFTW